MNDEWTMDVYVDGELKRSFKGNKTLTQMLLGVRQYLEKQKHDRK